MKKQFLRRIAVFAAIIFKSVSLSGQSPHSFEKPRFNPLPTISVAGVGDLMLASWAIPILRQQGFDYPFRGTSAVLSGSDLAIANLEAPLTIEGEPFTKKYNFKVPPEFASVWRDAGLTAVNLANNHMMDYGDTGLLTTLRTLDSLQVYHCGAGMNLAKAHEPAIVRVGGKRVALFGYSMTFPEEFYAAPDSAGTAYPDTAIMVRNIAKWDKEADFVVVSFHWSAEKREVPKEYQIVFAHLAIDSGADLVLGHHPHVLQGLEIYKNRLIAYSLGNYAFASYSKSARDSIILKTYLTADGLFAAYCIPINVHNVEVEFQPQVLHAGRRLVVIRKLQQLSRPLNDGRDILADSGLIIGDWAEFSDGLLLRVAVKSYFHVVQASDVFSGSGAGSSIPTGLPTDKSLNW